MKCQFCDRENPAGASTCAHCGAPLEGQVLDRNQLKAEAPAAADAPPAATGFEAEVVALLEKKQLIPAIKLYRERTGLGLKEAKEAVEAIARKRNIETRGAGCGTAVIAVLLLVAAVVWLSPNESRGAGEE